MAVTLRKLRDAGVCIFAAVLGGWATTALLIYYGFEQGAIGWALVRLAGLSVGWSVIITGGWRAALHRALLTVGGLIIAAPVLMLPRLIGLVWSPAGTLMDQTESGGQVIAVTIGTLVAFGLGMMQLVIFGFVIGMFVLSVGIWIGTGRRC